MYKESITLNPKHKEENLARFLSHVENRDWSLLNN